MFSLRGLDLPSPTTVPRAPSVHGASLEECFTTTDLKWRLGVIPDTALVRGVFLSMLQRQAVALGRDVEDEFESYFRVQGFSPLRLYPVREYLTRLVVLAQIRWGTNGIHAGLRALQGAAFETWKGTMVGRALVDLFEPTLLGCLRACERGYQGGASGNYADFAVLETNREDITVRFRNEYVYIEHAMVGAIERVARFCGERVALEVQLDEPFTGNVVIHRLGRRND